jgi:Trp operon repressor
LRDDLLINFLVSLFTSYKNLRSVPFNLGRMCLKQISSLFTITSHNSLSPIRLFCALVLTPEDMTAFVSRHQLLLRLLLLRSRKSFSQREIFFFFSEVKIGVFFRERQDNCLQTTDMKTTLREQLARYERIRKRPNEREKKRERENRECVHAREREMEEVRATPRECV